MANQKSSFPDLADRTVFISGGATGIGAALTTHFAHQGATTVFVDINETAGNALANSLSEQGYKANFIQCDITNTALYQSTIEGAAAKFGPITVLINNAANDLRHTLESITSEMFDDMIGVNLKHQMFAAQTVAPMMQAAGGGSIINFGSISWMISVGNLHIYTAAKAAIHGMTRGLARDLGPHNIRVNTLVPGWVMTEKQLDKWVDDDARKLIAESQCLAGSVMPEDIAQMALFLASDASAMCSAQNFIVDGGWT